MKIIEKIKSMQAKYLVIASILGLGSVGGVIPIVKKASAKAAIVREAIQGYAVVSAKVLVLEAENDSLKLILSDYGEVKSAIVHIMKDSEVSSGILSANMKKLDDKDYGTVLSVYDMVLCKYVRKPVKVKLRRTTGSDDIFVFISSISWGQEYWGIPLTRKFVAKWHDDDEAYIFFDKEGNVHYVEEMKVLNTIAF